MIHVIATIELNPGCREAFLAEFRRLVPEVVAEEGCLAYGPTVDVATGLSAQESPRADSVVVVEQWASVDHLRRHLEAPHMGAYRERVKELVRGLTLVVTEPA